MAKFPDHYELKNDDDKHYEIFDRRDKTSFQIAKKGIHPANQLHILKLKKFAEGGEVEEDNEYSPWGRMDDNKADQESTNMLNAFGFGEPTPEELAKRDAWRKTQSDVFGIQPQSVDIGPSIDQREIAMQSPMVEQATPPGMETLEETQPDTPVMAAPTMAQVTSGGNPARQPSSSGGYSGLGDLNKSQSMHANAIAQESQAKQAQNTEMAKVYEENLARQEQDMASFQQRMQAYQAEGDAISQEIASDKIDPDRYWNDRSTGSKVATALAVMISGIGQGLQGSTRNMAYDTLQKSIDRDIDSQKADLGRKQTLLSDNYRKQGNLMAAEQATRLQMGAMVQGKMAKLAAQTNNPIIAAQAQQQIAQIGMQMAPIKAQLAQFEVQKAGAQQAMQSGNLSSLINYAVPKHLQGKAYEELGAYKHLQAQLGQVDVVMGDVMKNNSIANRTMNPVQSKILAGQANARLFPIVKAIVGERMTDADARTLVEPYIMGVMSNKATGEKAAADLKNALMAQAPGKTPILSEHLKPYGVNLGFSGSNPTETKMRGGKPYHKVNGGWVPVGG